MIGMYIQKGARLESSTIIIVSDNAFSFTLDRNLEIVIRKLQC
jgi:hypothetical protein